MQIMQQKSFFVKPSLLCIQFKCIMPHKTVKSLLTTMVQKLLSKQALQKGAQKMCEKFPLNAPFSSFFKLPLLFCLKYFLHPSTHSMLHTWQILTPASSDLPQTFIPLSLYQKHTPCSSTDMKSYCFVFGHKFHQAFLYERGMISQKPLAFEYCRFLHRIFEGFTQSL